MPNRNGSPRHPRPEGGLDAVFHLGGGGNGPGGGRGRFVRHARRVNDFYAIGQGGNTLEEDALESLHPDLVPFADDAGGDQFCLSVGPDDYGSVYYVAHESYRPPAFSEEEDVADTPRGYGQGVYFLAPSFTAFQAGLINKSVE